MGMIVLILTVTGGLLLAWGAAFVERVESIITLRREPSLWSLALVGGIVGLHVLLLYAEGYILVAGSQGYGIPLYLATP